MVMMMYSESLRSSSKKFLLPPADEERQGQRQGQEEQEEGQWEEGRPFRQQRLEDSKAYIESKGLSLLFLRGTVRCRGCFRTPRSQGLYGILAPNGS